MSEAKQGKGRELAVEFKWGQSWESTADSFSDQDMIRTLVFMLIKKAWMNERNINNISSFNSIFLVPVEKELKVKNVVDVAVN